MQRKIITSAACLGFKTSWYFPVPTIFSTGKNAHQFTVPGLCQVLAIWACKLASQVAQILLFMNIATHIQPRTPSSFVSVCTLTWSSRLLQVLGSQWADNSNTPGISRATGLLFWISTYKGWRLETLSIEAIMHLTINKCSHGPGSVRGPLACCPATCLGADKRHIKLVSLCNVQMQFSLERPHIQEYTTV